MKRLAPCCCGFGCCSVGLSLRFSGGLLTLVGRSDGRSGAGEAYVASFITNRLHEQPFRPFEPFPFGARRDAVELQKEWQVEP